MGNSHPISTLFKNVNGVRGYIGRGGYPPLPPLSNNVNNPYVKQKKQRIRQANPFQKACLIQQVKYH